MLHPPFITLDEKSDVPLNRQIYESIRRSILSGDFFGQTLPASRFLAKQLGVSRTTVLNAYDQLLAEGYLEGKRGAGTFVAAHLPEEFLDAPGIIGQKDKPETARRDLKLSRYGKNVFEESQTILRNNPATPAVAFQHGLAAIDEFPFDVWTKLANKVYRSLPPDNFGYGAPAGFYPLRESVAAYLKSARAVNCTPNKLSSLRGRSTLSI